MRIQDYRSITLLKSDIADLQVDAVEMIFTPVDRRALVDRHFAAHPFIEPVLCRIGNDPYQILELSITEDAMGDFRMTFKATERLLSIYVNPVLFKRFIAALI